MTTKPMSARAGAMSRNMRLKLGLLTGTASLALIAAGAPALAQAPAAAPADAVEEIVVTGSLIRGAPVVGVPVTSLGQEQFAQQAATTVSDLFRRVPALDVIASTAHGASGSNLTRAQRANIHLQGSSRTLMLIDGMRFPLTGVYYDGYDPSIVPAIALQRVDVVATGASAVYGSDAIAGVMNLILRRNFNGATTQVMRQFGQDGGSKWQVAQLFGRTWDAGGGGGITGALDYQYESALPSADRDQVTWDFRRYGLDNRQPLRSSIPATLSFGPSAGAASPALPSAAVNPIGFPGSGCTNCLLVPAGQNGVGLTWARLLANPMVPQTATAPGTHNIVDPHKYSDYLSDQKRISGTLTFNQQITDNVEFFGDFLFSHRRVGQKLSPSVNPWAAGTIANVVVPRENPYFPIGTPAGTVVRANYSTALELNIQSKARETSRRWDVGFNIDLPYEWKGKIFYANNLEKNRAEISNTANSNNITAALGGIAGDPDGQLAPYTIGTAPRQLTAADIAANPSLRAYAVGTNVRVISPTQVPFLNLFCDPTAFQCNDRRTLDFVKAHWIDEADYKLQQGQIQFDGPLFALPGGQVRAAIGGSWVKEGLDALADRNQSLATAEITKPVTDTNGRTAYSAFGQINIPLVSEEMNIPLVSRLNVELSGRYDDYSDFGSTTNPRISADWSPISDLTLRGSWGKSFAAPAFQYLGLLAGKNTSALNLAAGAATNTAQLCTAAQVAAAAAPTAGTVAQAILGAIGAANCSDGAITAALAAQPAGSPYAGYNLNQIRFPGQVQQNGGAAPAYGISRPAGTLGPEKATNWSLGFGFAPKSGILSFLTGLDINATYWNVEIKNFIGSPADLITAFNDPTQRQFYVIKGADATNPAAPFATALQSYLTSPALASGVTPNAGTISVLRDNMARNLYRQSIDGVDFAITYARDMGGLGRWNVGLNGTYYLHYNTRNLITEAPRDQFDTPSNVYGVAGNSEANSRVLARGQIGWEDPDRVFDINFFANYRSHFFNNQAVPPTPTLENWLGVPQGSLSGAALAAANQKLMLVPRFVTFDLSIGYNLGERTSNRWLQGTQLRLTVNNIFDKQPPFYYRTNNAGAGPVAFDPTNFSPQGRIIAIQATKNW